jgi:cyclase
MLAKRIIPCLDIKAGRVVKGVKFLGLKDAGDPVRAAVWYDRQGADELVFLDITASSDERAILIDLVRKVAEAIFIPFTVGGGLRSVEDIRSILLAGADKISLNTAAVLDPALVRRSSRMFGSQCIVVAADVKREPDGRWYVYTHGGRRKTSREAVSWIRRVADLGAGEILLTSMDADGTKKGFDLEILRRAAEAVPIPIIASGGAGTLEHMAEGLVEGRADAVLAASVFHYRKYTVGQVKKYLRRRGIPVRI